MGKILLDQRSQSFELLIRQDLLHERSRTDGCVESELTDDGSGMEGVCVCGYEHVLKLG